MTKPEKIYVFGYGTLRSDVPSSSVPGFLKSIGKGTIPAELWKISNIYNYRFCPFWAGVTPNVKKKTKGEIYEITNGLKGLKSLDNRECINQDMYYREVLKATLKNKKEVEVYVYCTGVQSTKLELIESGDWKEIDLNINY